MPFYFDYDLLLLAVPAVLAARGRDADGRVIAAWVALFAWLMVNPHVAALTRVNGTVVLLALLAGVTMARAMRGESTSAMKFSLARYSGRGRGEGSAQLMWE